MLDLLLKNGKLDTSEATSDIAVRNGVIDTIASNINFPEQFLSPKVFSCVQGFMKVTFI